MTWNVSFSFCVWRRGHTHTDGNMGGWWSWFLTCSTFCWSVRWCLREGGEGTHVVESGGPGAQLGGAAGLPGASAALVLQPVSLLLSQSSRKPRSKCSPNSKVKSKAGDNWSSRSRPWRRSWLIFELRRNLWKR